MIDAQLALDLVRDCPRIAYDTETSGLDRHAFIVGYVVTGDGHSVYVPVRHEPGGNIPDAEEFEAHLAGAFKVRDARGYLTIGHNLEFDLKMSRRHGIRLNRKLEDTQINEGLINDIAPGFSLDACCTRHGVVAKKGTELYSLLAEKFGGIPERAQMKNYWRLPGDDPVAVDYAVGDGISTLALWEAQQRDIEELDLYKVHALECELIWYLDDLNARGMKVDENIAATIMDDLAKSIAEARAILPPGFNVRSPKELIAAYHKLGVTNFDMTPTGQPSFKEKWLETNELGRAVLVVRQLEKARDSFITPLIETNNVNGRVHPVLHQSKADDYGAIGGRLSCSEPNMQAFPKRNKTVGKVVRKLVVPDFGQLYEADFMQQEPHLFAHYSGDENMIAGYNAMPPIDMHDLMMTLTGRGRDSAKRLGMGVLTGMQVNAMMGHMGWTKAEAQHGIDEFLKTFPGIRKFQQLAKQVGIERGYVRTILGRIANCESNRFAYRMVSRIIQGSGADHTKTCLLRACKFAESVRGEIEILLTIHDSFMFQAEDSALPLIKDMIREMEDVQSPPFNFVVPIPLEIARGSNWSESSFGPKIKDPKRGDWLL